MQLAWQLVLTIWRPSTTSQTSQSLTITYTASAETVAYRRVRPQLRASLLDGMYSVMLF